MSKYIQDAKEVTAMMKDFIAKNNLSPQQEKEMLDIVFKSIRAMPWRGANYALKVSFMKEVGRNFPSIEVENYNAESDDGSKYQSVRFNVKQ